VPLTPVTAGLTIATSVANETFSELAPFQPDRSKSRLERKYTNEASDFVEVNGARVHYRDEGPKDAPTILALHGTYSSLHTWDGWADEFRDDFRFVRLDMPGFGLTGPRQQGEHSLEVLIETVAKFCDELGISDLTVAGNSVGGGVAWRLSLLRPDLVSRLVLVCAGGATLLSELAENFRTLGTDLFARYLTPKMVARLAIKDAYSDTRKVDSALVSRYHDLLLRRGNRRAVMEIARNYREDNMNGADSRETDNNAPILPSSANPEPNVMDDFDISAVSVPTLFQWGEDDTWLPESFGKELAANIPHSEFITYEGVGHVTMEEAPEITAHDAAAFISR
jgi:pimeloyl-ACP methyl ester carboxylesterase